MIDFNTYKQILIKNGINNLSEDEIIHLQDQQEQMADIFFSMWVDKIKNDKTGVK